ncbi:hypothetical protein ABZ446_06435 [Streptomyces sp. NPDC005813]|uniref:hypothetical protein n=1 Tax=unclassified Streptomyces TaxID=2593676 RepID=UPI0015CAF860|nr:hypothetical protein [Streptomyces sp. Tue6028]
MSKEKATTALLVVLVFAVVTCLAFSDPALGGALSVGVAVAALAWKMLRAR